MQQLSFGKWQMSCKSFPLDPWLKDLGTAIRARLEPIVREPLPEAMVCLVRRLRLLERSRDVQ
jgi:hypothetical protein